MQRIGGEVPAAHVAMRAQITRDITRACAVPLELVESADGTAAREAWRRFVVGSLAPLARELAVEIRDKLDVEFDFGRLRSSDLAGIGRAVQSLMASGVSLPEALAAAADSDPEAVRRQRAIKEYQAHVRRIREYESEVWE